jgi:hypothetical protein
MSTTSTESGSSVERVRRHRRRRRQGVRCITVDVSIPDLAALVAKGYLPEKEESDPNAIKAAIEAVISDMAFELEFGS